jgi:hypothetical protein
VTENGDSLIALCHEVGCSGVDARCPGNPNCAILKKLAALASRLEMKPNDVAYLARIGSIRKAKAEAHD